jgi:HEPN domain-containing protein
VVVPNLSKKPINPSSVMSDYFDYVEQYRIASAALSESPKVFWPRLQTRGLLIELALKTFICATGRVEQGHDLEVLARKAVDRGLSLSDTDWSERIKRVNKIYFKYLGWNAKYLSRYPTPNRGLAAWVTPGHVPLDEMIVRIVEQARARWDQH